LCTRAPTVILLAPHVMNAITYVNWVTKFYVELEKVRRVQRLHRIPNKEVMMSGPPGIIDH
jgi:hypothetical protein